MKEVMEMGFLGEDSEPISNDLIESYGIPTYSVEEYEDLVNNDEEPERAILNLDWNTGTHWVGVISRKNIIYYYDPFGVGYNLKINKPIIFNQIKDQELNESNCGWRSLYYVLRH